MQTSRFSRRTVLAAIDVFHRMSQAEFSRYIRGFGADFAQKLREEDFGLQARLNSLIDLVDKDPDQIADGCLLSEKLVEKAASFFPPTPTHRWEKPGHLTSHMEAFQRILSLDGFVVSDQTIRRSLPTNIDLPNAQDIITELLNKHQFATAKGHLEQALDAHGRGDWAAANSQIRTFLEAMLDEMAIRIDPSAASLNSSNARCTKLAAAGFLSRDLNEWEDSGKGFVNGLRNRLHPHGSHPGLSDDEDSTFRLHTVLITARLLLARFDSQGRS